MFFARGQSTGPLGVHRPRGWRQPAASSRSLNLGGHVGDDPAAVEANRRGSPGPSASPRDHLLFLQQCHGNDVVVVDGPWDGAGAAAPTAVVTATPGLALAALVADCTPVLLADPAAGVVGAVHAGRPGMTRASSTPRSRTCATRAPVTISAVVGPSVCGRCYEVPAEMRDEAAAGPARVGGGVVDGHPGDRRRRRRGRPAARRTTSRSVGPGLRPRGRSACTPTAATAAPAGSPGSSWSWRSS